MIRTAVVQPVSTLKPPVIDCFQQPAAPVVACTVRTCIFHTSRSSFVSLFELFPLLLSEQFQALFVALDAGPHDGLVAALRVVRVPRRGGGETHDRDHGHGGSPARQRGRLGRCRCRFHSWRVLACRRCCGRRSVHADGGWRWWLVGHASGAWAHPIVAINRSGGMLRL